MNPQSVKKLALLAGLLFAGLLIVNLNTSNDSSVTGELFIPELRSRANDIQRVAVVASPERTSTIVLTDGNWTVLERDNYPASNEVLRQLILALVDAKKLEQKTSDPARYAQLGVEEGDAASGSRITLSGDGFEFSVIIGNDAQSNYSYARVAGDAQSWMISERADIPDAVSEWLHADLTDIDAATVSAVTTLHADSEQIRIFRESEGDTDFQVANVPDGRELSYPTVANGMAGVLAGLMLEDVRKTTGAEPAAIATTRFELLDGTEIVVDSYLIDDQAWISLANDAEPQTSGWLYRIADYKKNLLTRRWDDILKAED